MAFVAYICCVITMRAYECLRTFVEKMWEKKEKQNKDSNGIIKEAKMLIITF